MRAIHHEQDVIGWANQQARWLRHKYFDLLDIDHLADEIEDLAKNEKREFAQRMARLVADLFKAESQPDPQRAALRIAIRHQRRAISRILTNTPSLKREFDNPTWWESIWDDAIIYAAPETGLTHFPEICPWSENELLKPDWFPENIESYR